MNLVKKFSVFALMIATVVSMSGGLTVKAAGNYDAGSLLAKANTKGAAVYYIGSDGMKYVFPDVNTYNTWYENFDNVVRVSVAELDMYPDGGAVTFREGTYLVTNENSAKVYAVEPGGVLRWIPTAETAAALYGANWGAKVKNVIPGFFSSSYTVGSDLGNTLPTGTIAMEQGGDTYYRIDGTTKRPFASMDAFEANNFNLDYVITANLSGYTAGTSITGEELALSGFMPAEGNGNGNQTGGDLTVSLAATTPASATVPKGATGVEATTYNLRASGSAVTVTSLKVVRSNIGSRDDIDKVYVYEGDTRLTSGRTLNSDDEASFNLNYVIPANTTKTLSIVVDLTSSAAAGDLHAFAFDEIVTGSNVSSSYSAGNSISIGGQAVGDLDIQHKNTESGTAADVKIGEDGVEIAEFDVDAIGNAEDLALTGFTLKNAGNANAGDISNVTLYYNGTELDEGTYDGEYITFAFDEVTLEKGESNYNFKVKADIEGGIDNTLRFYFDEKADVVAVGKTYSYNAGVDITDMDTSAEAYYMQIDGGTITVNYATANNETIIADQTDFVFATLEVNTAEEIDVDQFEITIDETDGSTNGVIDIDNVEIRQVETGSVYDGTVQSGSGDTATTSVVWKFENVIWPAGETTWEIRGDITSTATGGDAYEFDIDFTSGFTAEFADSNEAVATTDLSTTALSGKTYTIGSSSLTVIPGAFNAGEAVKDANDVVLAGGTFDAGSTSGVTITEVSFVGASSTVDAGDLTAGDDNYFDKDNIETVSLWSDANGDGTYEQLDSVNYSSLTNGEVTFDNFELNIEADDSVAFKVLANIDATLDGSNTNLHLQMSDVNATDDNNDSVSATETGENAVSTTDRVDFGRTVALYAVGTLSVAQDNTVSGVDRNKYVLAGTSDNKVLRLKMTADYEDVKITKLVLTNAQAAAYDSVNSVKITEADGTVLASEVFVGATATFDNDNGLFTVAEGTAYYYVTVDTRPIDSDSPIGTADSQDYFSVTITDSTGVEAQGASTGTDLSSFTNTADTDTTYTSKVVGTRITAIEDATNTNLATGEVEVMRFTITLNDDMTNSSTTGDDLNAVLEELAFTITYGSTTMTSTTGDASNYLKLYRVGKSGYATATIPVSGSKATFDLDNSNIYVGTGWTSSNREITVDDGAATFYLKATNVEGADTNDYVQVKIANVDGAAGSLGTNYDIKWHDGTGNMMYDFLLGYDELVGDSVN